MNKKLGIGIVVVAIVTVSMCVGCVEVENAPKATPTPVPTPSPTPSPTPTPVVTPTPSPTPSPTPMSVEEIKSKAKEVGYNDLFRYNEEWVGEIIYCIGLVVQVTGISDDRYVLRVYVTPIGKVAIGSSSWTNAIWVNYEGVRLLEDDVVDIWGEVKGLITYESVSGSEITIPEIDALHVELIAEAGEEWWEEKAIRDKMDRHWKRLGYI
ncbi:MAG: hypothetical protein WBC40_10965 [Halobacteriota archaeon]